MIQELLTPLWKEAIEFFGWENLKVFMLATLNTFKRSLMLFLKYFWWMIAIMMIAQYSGFYRQVSLFLFFSSFISILMVRPSIESKNLTYFLGYGKKIPGYFLIIFFFIAFTLIINQCMFFFLWLLGIPSFSSNTLFLPLSPILIASFFFIDVKSDITHLVKSVFNSLKFCLYFFPVICALILFERLIFLCFGFSRELIGGTNSSGGMIFYVIIWAIAYLLTLLPFSALAVYYTKIKHNHFPLFF